MPNDLVEVLSLLYCVLQDEFSDEERKVKKVQGEIRKKDPSTSKDKRKKSFHVGPESVYFLLHSYLRSHTIG